MTFFHKKIWNQKVCAYTCEWCKELFHTPEEALHYTKESEANQFATQQMVDVSRTVGERYKRMQHEECLAWNSSQHNLLI